MSAQIIQFPPRATEADICRKYAYSSGSSDPEKLAKALEATGFAADESVVDSSMSAQILEFPQRVTVTLEQDMAVMSAAIDGWDLPWDDAVEVLAESLRRVTGDATLSDPVVDLFKQRYEFIASRRKLAAEVDR